MPPSMANMIYPVSSTEVLRSQHTVVEVEG